MQVTETQIDELTRQFHVAVPSTDIERKVETRLGELAHSVRIPGFRPGKVPVALLRKRFGESVRQEVVGEAINETSQSVIEERGLRAALPPRVEIARMPGDGDLEFTVAVELLPEITPPDYGQIRLERLVPQIDESEIDERVARLAETLGGEEVVAEERPVQAGDIVVFDVLAPDDKYPFEENGGQGVRLRADEQGPLGAFGRQLIGRSAGAQAEVTLTLPEGAREDLAGQTRTYEVVIKELRTLRPAPIDDDLAKRGGWEDLDDLRGWLRRAYEGELKSLARLRLKRALLDRLAELYGFAVPKGLLAREYEALVRQLSRDEAPNAGAPAQADEGHGQHQHDESCGHDHDHHDHDHHHDDEHPHHHHHQHGSAADAPADPPVDAALPEERRNEYRALAERRVRLGLLLAEIGRSNNLRVTQEELGKAMLAHARRFPGQEQAVLEFLRKSPELQESLAAPILEDKVIDFIVEMAQVSDRPVPAPELLRELEQETTSSSGSPPASS